MKNIFKWQSLAISLSAILVAVSFQNCAPNSGFETLNEQNISNDENSIANPENTTNIETICRDINSVDDFFRISDGTKKLIKKYCITTDLDFSNIALSKIQSVRYIVLDGQNHHLYGLNMPLKYSLFSSISYSIIKNIHLGHSNISNGLTIPKTPSPLLVASAAYSSFENISITNPQTNSIEDSTSNCSLMFGSIRDSTLNKISISLGNDLILKCAYATILSNGIDNKFGFTIKDIKIKSTGRLNLETSRGMATLVRFATLPHLSNVEVDIADMEVAASATTQNSSSVLISSIDYDKSFTHIDFNNISVKGLFKFKNINGFGAIAYHCANTYDSVDRSFTVNNFNIRTQISIDNSASTWGAGSAIGSLCGSSETKDISFLNGQIDSELSFNRNTSSNGKFLIGGLIGISYSQDTMVKLSLSTPSKVSIQVPTEQAADTRKGKYVYTNDMYVVTAPGSQAFTVLFNQQSLN